jgi:hypothetical protein
MFGKRSAIRRVDSSKSGFFAMPNPWDRQPLPSVGNADPNDIRIGVGLPKMAKSAACALDAW